jgi:uncharacterized protein
MTEATIPETVLSPSFAPATTATPTLGPVRPLDRIELLDVLRGFALFGILQTNFSDWGGNLEKFILFCIDGSFYPLYSFLFGLGFAIQMLRAEDAGRSFALRYAWRSTILLAIGAAHYVFVFPGDILHRYAPVSLLLLLIHKLRTWMLWLVAGVVCLCFLQRIDAPVTLLSVLYRPTPEALDPSRVETALESQRFSASRMSAVNGTMGTNDDLPYVDRVRGRIEGLTAYMTRPYQFDQWMRLSGDILFMFILGLIAGRKRIIRNPAAHRRLLVGLAIGGAAVGVVGNFYDNFSDVAPAYNVLLGWLPPELGWLTYSAGNIGLTLFYFSGLTLLFTYRARARWFLAPLAYAGRMGLTNYLMQSIVCTLVLWRPGLALNAALGRWEQQLFLTSFFLVQLLYSRWWFERFQFGPAEWAWRSLTWLRFQPARSTNVRLVEASG